MSWKRLTRTTIYSSPFISLYEDKVQLENGAVIDDFSVVEFRNGVVVVATDIDGKLIAIDEYKYAVDEVLRVLPAGGVEEGYTPEEAAIKELREETGYEGESAELITTYYEYPSKLPHITNVVRVRNAHKVHKAAHELTESISGTTLLDFTEDNISQFRTSVNVAALYRALGS
ncbi:MAG: NUDIX hydrolase [Candidatus Saccharimonas sp.]